MNSSPPRADAFVERRLGPESFRTDDGDATGLVVEFAQATRMGATRTNNEDAVGCWRHCPGLLFAVADGLGGLDRGEVASRRALDVLAESVTSAPSDWGALRRLRHGAERANLAIHVPGEPPMATTLTATMLSSEGLTSVHVGDCRLLRLRDGVLEQLTRDHNVAGRLVSFGLMSPQRAADHRTRRMVTRCLGQEPFVQIETVRSSVHAGDAYIQCSDGIAAVPPEEIAAHSRSSDPLEVVASLIDRAVALGADDDVSVQLLRVVAYPKSAEPVRRPFLGGLFGMFGRGSTP